MDAGDLSDIGPEWRIADLSSYCWLYLLLICHVPFIFYTVCSGFCWKKTWQLLWLIFVPASLNIVLNFVFISIYGYRVAILTTIISYWSICFIALLVPYYRKHLRDWLGNPFQVLWLFVFCLLMLVVSQFVGSLSTLNKGIITCVFLLICCCVIVKKWQRLRDFNFVHSDINWKIW